MNHDTGVTPSGSGSRPSDGAEGVSTADAASIPNANRCACGVEISRWSTRCHACRDRAIVAAADHVEPSAPMCIVGDDTFFYDLQDAAETHAGQFAHPCDPEPLKIARTKRTAVELVDRVIEEMCEDAFEDAIDYVKDADSLRSAFEVALEAFNEAQTATTWTPRTNEVFVIPASADTHRDGGDAKQAPGDSLSGAVPKADAQ